MKRLLMLSVLFVCTKTGSVLAQGSSSLLTAYYALDTALVTGDAHAATVSASNLVRALGDPAVATVPTASKDALRKEAASIAAREDLGAQRMHFAGLSATMAALAKTVRLSATPVYVAYCPMKKAYWLSADKTIQNPYFGNAMLTCGKVVDTL